jgi:hypothetical protein
MTSSAKNGLDNKLLASSQLDKSFTKDYKELENDHLSDYQPFCQKLRCVNFNIKRLYSNLVLLYSR